MIRSLLYVLAVGIVGAALVHIAIILAIPTVTDRDAWTRLSQASAPNVFFDLRENPQTANILEGSDPLFRVAACHFDLREGPVRLYAEGRVPFWSISILNRRGSSIFSFNDRNASGPKLDIVVTAPANAAELRDDTSPQAGESFIVEAAPGATYAVLRVFVPDNSWTGTVVRFLRNAECGAY